MQTCHQITESSVWQYIMDRTIRYSPNNTFDIVEQCWVIGCMNSKTERNEVNRNFNFTGEVEILDLLSKI